MTPSRGPHKATGSASRYLLLTVYSYRFTVEKNRLHKDRLIKCLKAVIPAKAGIQENTLDAGSSPA